MEYNSVEEFTISLYEDGIDNSSLVAFVEELFSKISELESELDEVRHLAEELTNKEKL